MSEQVSYLLGGLSTGSIYAVIAAGLAILLKSSHRFNFAQISLVMLGGYIVYEANENWGVGFVPAILISVVAVVCCSLLTFQFVAKPLSGRRDGMLAVSIATLGVDAVIRTGVISYTPWNRELTEVGTPWQATTTDIFGAPIYTSQLWIIAIAVATLGAIVAALHWTRYGVLFRAIAEDEEAAAANGVPIKRVLLGAWALAGVLAALAGMFAGSFPRLLAPETTPELALRAIPAVVIGGMSSIGGSIAGGVLVGVVEVYSARYAPSSLGSNFQLIMPYVVMIGVLLVRPQGLFGEREIRRV